MKGFAKSILPGEYDITADEAEGALSIALGGLLGGAFGWNAHRMEKANTAKLVESENKNYTTFVKDVVPAAQAVMRENVTSILKANGTIKVPQGDKEIEVPNYEVDEQGNWVTDDEAVMRLVTNGLQNQAFWDLELVMAMNNNQTGGELTKEMGLLSAAYTLATNKSIYSKDDVLAIIKGHTELGDAEAKRLGIDTMIRENMDTVTKYIDAIEATNNKYQTAKSISNPEEFGFKQFMLQTDLYLQGKLAAINRIRREHKNLTPKLSEQLNILEADILNHMELLKEEPWMKEVYGTLVRPQQLDALKFTELQKKKDKTQEDYDELRALSYLIDEDQYINGTFAVSTTGARTSPIGLSSSRLIKTERGKIDDHNFNIGKSWAAIRRAQQLVNKENPTDADWKQAMSDFFKVNVDIDADLMSDTAQKLTGKIDEEAASYKESLQKIGEIERIANELNSILEMPEEPVLASTLLSPETMAALQIPADALIGEAEITQLQDEFNKTASAAREIKAEAERTVMLANIRKNEINNYRQRIDEQNSEHTKFLNAPDKDAYLMKKFYEDTVQTPTKAFIQEALDNKDTFDDLETAELYINKLKNVIAAYTTRKDEAPTTVLEDAERLLDIMESEVLEIKALPCKDYHHSFDELDSIQIDDKVFL